MGAFCVSLRHQRAAEDVRGTRDYGIGFAKSVRATENDAGIERGLDCLDLMPLPELP